MTCTSLVQHVLRSVLTAQLAIGSGQGPVFGPAERITGPGAHVRVVWAYFRTCIWAHGPLDILNSPNKGLLRKQSRNSVF